MKIITWNVRGMRCRDRTAIIGKYLHSWKADIVLIQETHLHSLSGEISRSFDRFAFDGHVMIPSVGRGGGHLILWRLGAFDLIDSVIGRHSITVLLKRLSDNLVFLVSAVYGPKHISDQELMWIELQDAR